MGDLQHAQRWILDYILDKVALHDASHGFRKQRSIVSDARPHVGADVVPRRQVLGRLADVFASAIGYTNFVRMVDPAKGAELLARAKELAAKHGWQPKKRPPPKPPAGPAGGGAPSGRPPDPPPPEPASPEPGPPEPAKKKWWQVFDST